MGPQPEPEQRSGDNRHVASGLPRISTVQGRRFDPTLGPGQVPWRERAFRGHRSALLPCSEGLQGGRTEWLKPSKEANSGLCSVVKARSGSQRKEGRVEEKGQTGGQLCVAISVLSPREQPGLLRVWGPPSHETCCVRKDATLAPRSTRFQAISGVGVSRVPRECPIQSPATPLTSCSSASTPRAERTKPRSGRSADTDAPTPCAGLLVLVLTFDGNSAMTIETLRGSGPAPGAAPGLRLLALSGFPWPNQQVRDAPLRPSLRPRPLTLCSPGCSR